MRQRSFHSAITGLAVILVYLSALSLAPGANAAQGTPEGKAAAQAPRYEALSLLGEQDREELLRLEETYGITIVSLRITADGNMLDFRYKVLDTEKAAPLHSRGEKPYLLHERTGKALSVPVTAKAGPMRSTYPPKKDRIYFMLFSTPKGMVQSGDKARLEMGDIVIKNLLIQ